MMLGLPRTPPIVEIEEVAKKEFVLFTPVSLRVGAANRIPAPPLQKAVQLVWLQDRDIETPTPHRARASRMASPSPRISRPFESSLPWRVVQNRWIAYSRLSAL